MGNDFSNYDEMMYTSIDQLINFFNNHPCKNLTLKYSEYAKYFRDRSKIALEIDPEKNWSIKKLDFFPYYF
jgi:hypothetical protein